MKKRTIALLLGLIMVIGVMAGCSKTEYTLNLPTDPKQIVLTIGADDRMIEKPENIKMVMDILSGERITTIESTQDSPGDVDEEIKIDFIHEGDAASTLFVYKKDDKCYIEQPYNGIYEITTGEYNEFKTFYDGLKQDMPEIKQTGVINRIKSYVELDQYGKSFKPSDLTNEEMLRFGFYVFGPAQNSGLISIDFEGFNRTYIKPLGRDDITPANITCECGNVIANYNAATDEITWDAQCHHLAHSSKTWNEIADLYQIEDRLVIELYKIFPDVLMNSTPGQYNFYPTYNDALNKTNVLFSVANESEFEEAVKNVDDTKKTKYRITFVYDSGYKLVSYEILDK